MASEDIGKKQHQKLSTKQAKYFYLCDVIDIPEQPEGKRATKFTVEINGEKITLWCPNKFVEKIDGEVYIPAWKMKEYGII